MTTRATGRNVTVVGRAANGQPRTYRLSRPARESPYRRLAAAILGLDITTLAVELRTARLSAQERMIEPACVARRQTATNMPLY